MAIIRKRMVRKRNCAHHKMKAETIAKLAPDTATKWVRPERRISVRKFSLCSEVSPKTMPGISEPASPVPLASRSPKRMLPSAAAHRVGALITFTSVFASKSAATRGSLLRVICTLADNLCPGSNFAISRSVAINRTGICNL